MDDRPRHHSFGPFSLHGTRHIITTSEKETYNDARQFRDFLPHSLPAPGDVRWYHVLDVPRHAPAAEINRAAVPLMRRTHPDKTRDQSSRDAFIAIRKAQQEGLAVKVFLTERKEHRSYGQDRFDFFNRPYKYYYTDRIVREVPPMSRECAEALFDEEDVRKANGLHLYSDRLQNLRRFTKIFGITSIGVFFTGLFLYFDWVERDRRVKKSMSKEEIKDIAPMSKWKRRAIAGAGLAWGGVMCAVGGLCRNICKKMPEENSALRNKYVTQSYQYENNAEGIKIFTSHGVEGEQYVIDGSGVDSLLSEQRHRRTAYNDQYRGVRDVRNFLLPGTRIYMPLGVATIIGTLLATVAVEYKRSKDQENNPVSVV